MTQDFGPIIEWAFVIGFLLQMLVCFATFILLLARVIKEKLACRWGLIYIVFSVIYLLGVLAYFNRSNGNFPAVPERIITN